MIILHHLCHQNNDLPRYINDIHADTSFLKSTFSLAELKLMLDLCKQKTLENVPMAKCNSGGGIYEPVQLHRNIRPSDQPLQPDRSFVRPVEDRRHPVGNNMEKPESNRISGTYIVGGSAFGWNFITFHGTKPEYYGRTKEVFRAGK